MNNVSNNGSSQTLPYGDEQSQSDNSAKTNISQPVVLPQEELEGKTATIKTDKGDIVIKFYTDVAPVTVSNFVQLSKQGFYDGLTFHRREEGFVIQGGDPLGNGTGGPGYTVPAELSAKEHKRGAIAMARLSDSVNPRKDSSGSQFYICLDAANFLDGEYTVFGEVVSGMEVADQIKVGDKMNSVVISE